MWFNRKSQPHYPPPVQVNCPDCGGGHFAIITALYRILHTSSGPMSEMDGARLSCQKCGAIFNVSAQGAYRQHEDALPMTLKPGEAEQRVIRAIAKDRKPPDAEKEAHRNTNPLVELPPLRQKKFNP